MDGWIEYPSSTRCYGEKAEEEGRTRQDSSGEGMGTRDTVLYKEVRKGLQRGKSKYKSPEVESCSECSRKNREGSMTKDECEKGEKEEEIDLERQGLQIIQGLWVLV